MTKREREAIVRKMVTEYISKDGRLFDSEEACDAWEKQLDFFNSELSKIETNPEAGGWMNIDGCEHVTDAGYDWYRPKSKEEIDILKRKYGDEYDEFRYDMIGKWICIEVDDGSVYVSELDSGIFYAKELLKKFGYRVTIEKEDNR